MSVSRFSRVSGSFSPALQVQVPAFHREVPLPPPPVPMASQPADSPAPCSARRRRSAAAPAANIPSRFCVSSHSPLDFLFRGHANTRKIQDLHWFRPWPKPDAAHGYIGAGFQRRPQCHKQAHLYMLIISIPCGNSSGPHRSPLQGGKGSTGNSESRLPRHLQSCALST